MRSKYLAYKTDILELLIYAPAVAACRLRHFWYARRVDDVRTASKVVVSLTSFPERLGKLHNCVRSLLSQQTSPQRIVLYLAKEECGQIELPASLTQLQSDQFEIRMVDENAKSLNKLIHAIDDFPDWTVVTCDDDKIYPYNWLAGLITASERAPGTVVCNRARRIVFFENEARNYRSWPMVDDTRAAMSVLPLGVGGVLYPPGSLHEQVGNLTLFRQLSPTSDDLWLKTMAVLNGTIAVQVATAAGVYASIPFWKGTKLSVNNIWGSDNDRAFKNLLSYFQLLPEDFK